MVPVQIDLICVKRRAGYEIGFTRIRLEMYKSVMQQP